MTWASEKAVWSTRKAASTSSQPRETASPGGWRALWIPELIGREALTHAGYRLSCTEHVINGIAQI